MNNILNWLGLFNAIISFRSEIKALDPFSRQSDRRFHIIHVEDWGTSLPDTATLTQQYLFTVEAFTAYLSHLTENGLVIISRKLLLPPADSIRLWRLHMRA